MASLYVEEFNGMGSAHTLVGPHLSAAQAPSFPSVASQLLSITGSSTAGNPFNSVTAMIRVNTDSVCSIAIGPSPVAVPTAMRLAANQTEFFAVRPGDTIAVITNT